MALRMALTPATRLGSYEIIEKIGEGGMGEVYRARDTRLERDVAIKVLLDSVAQDAERLARFEREARLLASLNHAHIAQIYGLDVSGVTTALVMELVEGPTLADRIAQGPLPLDEALGIARQLVEALEAAHDHGIVHRDLKPANIKLRPDGTVKVLDFGLAKFAEAAPNRAAATGPFTATVSPTMTSPAVTQIGIVLGTAVYMSPEQARGRSVDKRADIWAFGVIVYEMLAGVRPFSGDDITEMLAAVVKDQPDLAKVPLQLRRLIGRCLEKDPRRRLRDIGDVWDLLDEPAGLRFANDPMAATWRRITPWAIAGAFALVAVAMAVMYVRAPSADTPAPVRFQIATTQEAGNARPAVSPDGRHIVYQAGNQIFVRDLDAVAPRVLATTEAAVASPFWSADSRFVIFGDSRRLMKIPAAGGPAQELCDLSGILIAGFAPDDKTILFISPPDGLRQVSSQGGASKILYAIPGVSPSADTNERFTGIGSRLLPGRRIVYSKESGNGESGVYVGSLDGGGTPVRVLSDITRAVDYVPATAGGTEYLLFTRNGTLMAQAFDSRRLQVSGEPTIVGTNVTGFSTSATGTIVFTDAGQGRRLVWMNRQGQPIGTAGAPQLFNELSVSPDGSKVAVVLAGGLNNASPLAPSTWIYDFARESSVKLSKWPGTSLKPVWSPDGSRVAFASNHGGALELYAAPASGTGPDELLLKSPALKYPQSWSRDDRWLLFTSVDPVTKEDLWVLPMTGDGARTPQPFLVTNYHETDGSFSPDSRSVAYVSDESGTSEVYVRGFPSGEKHKVSTGGGYQPRWRSDGKELFYLSARGQFMSADIRSNRDDPVGMPRPLFQASIYGGGASINNWYWDVAPGGDRLLVNASSTDSGTSLVTVVVNWQAGLHH